MGHTLSFPLGPVGSAPAAEVEAVGVGRSRARVLVVLVAEVEGRLPLSLSLEVVVLAVVAVRRQLLVVSGMGLVVRLVVQLVRFLVLVELPLPFAALCIECLAAGSDLAPVDDSVPFLFRLSTGPAVLARPSRRLLVAPVAVLVQPLQQLLVGVCVVPAPGLAVVHFVESCFRRVASLAVHAPLPQSQGLLVVVFGALTHLVDILALYPRVTVVVLRSPSFAA